MNYESAVNIAYDSLDGIPPKFPSNIGQNRSELLECAKWLEKIKPANFLEIGSQYGGTFLTWCGLCSGKKISVDLLGGPFGGIDINTYEWRCSVIHGQYPEAIFLNRNSHDEGTFVEVAGLLKGELLDFLFIDGDHSYLGVKQDYEMYKPLVRKGGLIGFHDIEVIEECEVNKFWNELQGNKIEIRHKASWVPWRTNLGGIGLIVVE